MARAMLENDRYIAHAPEPVGNPETLLERMHKVVGEDDTILISLIRNCPESPSVVYECVCATQAELRLEA